MHRLSKNDRARSMHRLGKNDIANKFLNDFVTLQVRCVVCKELVESGSEYVSFTLDDLVLDAHPQCIEVYQETEPAHGNAS